MKSPDLKTISRLDDLPYIGQHIADDLRAIGITSPAELRKIAPLSVFNELKVTMGRRHDPCVFYTPLAVKHYFDTAESLALWRFTAEGKNTLNKQRRKSEPIHTFRVRQFSH